MSAEKIIRDPTSLVRKIELAIIGLTLMVSGCMLGPDFHQPRTSVAKKWIEAKDPALDSSPEQMRKWWTVFDDPGMTRIVGLAYNQNLTLLTAGLRVVEARAQLGVAIGQFFPQQQQLTGSTTYNRIPVSLPYKLINNNYWASTIGAQVGWELDLWGKLRRGIQSADYAYLASVANYDDVLVMMIGDVASTYVQIRVISSQLAIAKENVDRQKKALEIAEVRYEGGVVTKRDVYQARNVLGATEAAVPQLNIRLDQAKNALSVLLGMPPGQLDSLLAGISRIPTAPARIVAGIPADLLRRRPDIRRAELEAAAQCARIGFTEADLYPTFSLTGTIGTLSSNIAGGGLNNLFTSNSLIFSVGPAVQWKILNYGQVTNNVRVQDAKFQELLVDYQNTVLKAQQQVEDGIETFLESRAQSKLLEQSVQAATGALRIAMTQYREGTADFTTVLTAEENLYQAQNNLVVAEGNIALGLINAYRAMGGGWRIRQGRDFVPAGTRRQMEKRTNWGTLLTPVDLLQPHAPGLPSSKDVGPSVRAPEW